VSKEKLKGIFIVKSDKKGGFRGLNMKKANRIRKKRERSLRYLEKKVRNKTGFKELFKTCSRCCRKKSISEFQRDRRRGDGFLSNCKECQGQKINRWRMDFEQFGIFIREEAARKIENK